MLSETEIILIPDDQVIRECDADHLPRCGCLFCQFPVRTTRHRIAAGMIVQQDHIDSPVLQRLEKNLPRRDQGTVHGSDAQHTFREKPHSGIQGQQQDDLSVLMPHPFHVMLRHTPRIRKCQKRSGALSGDPFGQLRDAFELHCLDSADPRDLLQFRERQPVQIGQASVILFPVQDPAADLHRREPAGTGTDDDGEQFRVCQSFRSRTLELVVRQFLREDLAVPQHPGNGMPLRLRIKLSFSRSFHPLFSFPRSGQSSNIRTVINDYITDFLPVKGPDLFL